MKRILLGEFDTIQVVFGTAYWYNINAFRDEKTYRLYSKKN